MRLPAAARSPKPCAAPRRRTGAASRGPSFSSDRRAMRGLSGLADQLLAVADRLAGFPRQMAQPAGERIMTPQAARCQDMADLVGEAIRLGIHQFGDPIHD